MIIALLVLATVGIWVTAISVLIIARQPRIPYKTN